MALANMSNIATFYVSTPSARAPPSSLTPPQVQEVRTARAHRTPAHHAQPLLRGSLSTFAGA